MVDFEAITITPLVQMGVAGMWIVYLIWKEKNFNATITKSIDNNTNAVEKLVYALEADNGNK